MKIKYFGTAAAEGVPGLFCFCDICERARKAGGKNIRTRSQAIINNDLLIDFPADTYMHMLTQGLDLKSISNILITHGHEDHLYPLEFGNTRPPYALYRESKPPVTVYSSYATAKILLDAIAQTGSFGRGYVEQKTVYPGREYQIGRYTVVPLEADHRRELQPLIYAISDGEKALLYAHDTGYFPDKTWQYLEEEKPYFSYISLDCTCTNDDESFGNHMGLKTCTLVKNRLLQIGCADEKTVFCLNHFSHNGGYTYDELVPVAKKFGFTVSYDSMEYEF